MSRVIQGTLSIGRGPKGKDGSMSFEELTEEQKQELIKGVKGEKGDRGPQGEKGDPGKDGKDGVLKFQELSPEEKKELKGEKGDQGPKGDRGDVGPAGKDGAIGPVGPRGEQGIPGKDGAKGEKGADGAVGPQGPAGQDGKDAVVDEEKIKEIIKGMDIQPGAGGGSKPKLVYGLFNSGSLMNTWEKFSKDYRTERYGMSSTSTVLEGIKSFEELDVDTVLILKMLSVSNEIKKKVFWIVKVTKIKSASSIDVKGLEYIVSVKPDEKVAPPTGGSSEGTPFIMPMIGPGMFRMCGAINLGSASNTHYTDIYKQTHNNRCVMVMPIPVKPGTKLKVTGYTSKWQFAFHLYDASGKNVTDSGWHNSSKPGWSGNNTFTVPSDKEYRMALLYCGNTDGRTIDTEALQRLCGGYDQAYNALTVTYVD